MNSLTNRPLQRDIRPNHRSRYLQKAISLGLACSIPGFIGTIAYAEPAAPPAPATVPAPAAAPATTAPESPVVQLTPQTPAAPAASDPQTKSLALLAPVALAAGAKPADIAAATATEIRRNENGDPLITNSFADTDLKEALSDIATQAGVSIVADNTVQGSVTIDLKDVPLERALSMVIRGGGYTFAKVDDYYLVGAPEPTNPNYYLFSRTEVVQLQNIRPEVVLQMLSIPYGKYLSAESTTHIPSVRGSSSDESSRSVGGGYSGSDSSRSNNGSSADVAYPASTYKVIITAPPTLVPRIKADIQALDQKHPQVLLEAMILEISQDDLKNMGFNLATRWLQFSTNTNNNNNNGTTTGSNFGYSSIANNELVQISALIQKGAARVRANPRVATGDGQTAEMEVGKENYFSIVSGTTAYAYNTLEVIKSGISLRVTPRILENGQITALVEPEVRDVTGAGANGLPEITFRRAATNVRVRNGESIVIGGLVNEYDVTNKSKIPLLGDIPIVGKAFRGENTRKARTETVIIVTPRILTDDEATDGIQSPVLKADVQTYREANHVKAADANGAGLTVPTLPPLVAPTPGVPAPGAPTP